MTETTITTPFRRELIVEKDNSGTYLEVKASDGWAEPQSIKTFLPEETLTELADALLGENATVITDLPEARLSVGAHRVYAGECDRSLDRDPEGVLKTAKELLAIHAFLVRHNEEKEAADKAEAKEVARDKRRDELGNKFRGLGEGYKYCTIPTKAAINYIIDLEEAAKVS